MKLETQNTIVLDSIEHTTNDIMSTCQVESIPYKTLSDCLSDRLSDRDLQLLLEYSSTKDDTKKKVFDHLYFPLRIRGIMPVKVVYLEEILIESNGQLMIKMLDVYDGLVRENKDMKEWIKLLKAYGMTWNVIHSLYVTGTTDLGTMELGSDVEFGLRNLDVEKSNDEIFVQVMLKIQKYFIITGSKDLGFWIEIQVLDQDLIGILNVFNDHGWIRGILYCFNS